MTALHVEGLDLCRKSAQQDWLIDGVCHEPLRSFRNILRLKKALLIFKTKKHSKTSRPTAYQGGSGKRHFETTYIHPDVPVF